MANYTAADVKKLREETDAPMMECKSALEEAEGDYDRAKLILREKGKAAAVKRADRSTSAGLVAFALSADQKTLGGVLLESETDFVAKNEEFGKIAQEIAEIFRDVEFGDDPLSASKNGRTVKDIVEEAVGKIRENIRVAKAVHLVSDGAIATYVHHDKTKGAAITVSGDLNDSVRKIAIQVVASPPDVVSKDQLSQEKINQEIEIETKRAIDEGKDEKIARNVAQGRVNKEFVKKAVLLEQPFYADPSKSVADYLKENGGAQVQSFVYFAVGASN